MTNYVNDPLEGAVRSRLRTLSGCTGFSVKRQPGEAARIRIYVADTRKASEIPDRIAGVPVSLASMPQFHAPRPAPPQDDGEKLPAGGPPVRDARIVAAGIVAAGAGHGGLRAGARVSARAPHLAVELGCAGGFVEGNGSRWLLSANHALAGNGAFLDFDPHDVNQGIFAGDANVRVGRQPSDVRFVRMTDDDGRADAAICRMDGDIELATSLYDEPQAVGAEGATPVEDARVHFRTPGGAIRQGRIEEADGQFGVRMALPGLGLVQFRHHVVIKGDTPLIGGGESGSMVIQEVDGRLEPLGLIVGFPESDGDDTDEDRRALVCPLRLIFDQPEIRDSIGGIRKILVP
jgi:hypothetical protein